MRVYKLVEKRNDGTYHPLYVNRDTEFVLGEKYLPTEAPEDFIHGIRKVKSALGFLSWRPGIHCCEFPLADHIGVKQADGTLAQRPNNVWLECEFDLPDITDRAMEQGRNKRGKVIPVKACFRELQYGYYWYQTTPKAKVRWVICSEITPIREVPNEEVAEICRANGFEPQKLAV